MTKTCLHYLCLDIFDPEIEDQQIKENLLSGAYRLHWFASTQWVEILRHCAISLHDRAPPDDLITTLKTFGERRENTTFQDSSSSYGDWSSDHFEAFKGKHPEIYRLLDQTLKFWHLDTGNWKLDYEGMWIPSLFYNIVDARNELKRGCGLRWLVDSFRSADNIKYCNENP